MEPFKNNFNPDMIQVMADCLAEAGQNTSLDFDPEKFFSSATQGLEPLELRQRSKHIQVALESTLPADFASACKLMLAALAPRQLDDEDETISFAIDDTEKPSGIKGWGMMPMMDYVAERGLDRPAFSLDVLAEMTRRFSSEFAIRPFFAEHTDLALKTAMAWTQDPSVHVRRLASEGSRTMLPWGQKLHCFVEQPQLILPILEALKDDKSEYVRRSVANSLNDISKDHPDLVAGIAKDWLKGASKGRAGKDRTRMVKHACRGLIKQGHPATLTAFGYGPPALKSCTLTVLTPKVRLGDALEFELQLTSQADTKQSLLIDYIVHHQKANGTLSPKVFKWKTLALKPDEAMSLSKVHKMKPITTRVYHAGLHEVEIQINGQQVAKKAFDLEI